MKIPPYVGPYYDKYRIMLVGESHYIKDCKVPELFNSWYVRNINFSEEVSNQFNTTYQVNYFLNKGKGLYAIYRFPANVLARLFMIPYTEAFKYVMFYNYFQRPNLFKGSFKSIYDDDRDYTYAAESFLQCIVRYVPEICFFLSKKSYQSLQEYMPVQPKHFHCLVHPRSAWWFMNNGKHGDKKMEELMRSFLLEKYSNLDDIIVKDEGL